MTPDSTTTIGLFGGSFNPPHIAHVLVLTWALAAGEVDEVWVIPTGGHPFGKDLAPFNDRFEMCRLAFEHAAARARVLDIEREPRVHYTIDTLRRLASAFPENQWRWLMGSDTVTDAPRWKNFGEIQKLAPPLIIPRQGHSHEPSGFALPNLSSTFIRDHLAAGRAGELEGLLPRPVLAYIKKNNLYQKAATTGVPTADL